MDMLQGLQAFAAGLGADASYAWATATDWVDRLDGDELNPVLAVSVVLLVIWGALLMIPAPSDERAKSYWTSFAACGRWVALGASVVPVVVWAATRK